ATATSPTDPRAAAMGAGIVASVRQARTRAAHAVPTAGPARRSSASSTAPSAREPASRDRGTGFGPVRGPGAPIGVARRGFDVKVGGTASVRSVQAFPGDALQRAVGRSLADEERTVR